MGHASTAAQVGEIGFFVIAGLIVLALAAGLTAHFLVRSGRRAPLAVRMVGQAADAVVDAVREPVTVAVLDEVADVLAAGAYTRNIAAALRENHRQLSAMLVEKLEADRTTRLLRVLPYHDRLLREVSESALRVVLEVLGDPRTEELFRDLLRDNITQLRQAVRDRHAPAVSAPTPPG